MELGICVHCPKSNPCYQGRQFKKLFRRTMPLFQSIGTLTFCNISVFTEDIYLKLRICVYYPKSNLHCQGRQFKCICSSPEHKMLMGSFCDRPMFGVRRPSCVVRRASYVVHNFFKHLLLLNQWANLDETWQGCSLGEALPKSFKRLNSTNNSGCHGNRKKKRKIFENLLL